MVCFEAVKVVKKRENLGDIVLGFFLFRFQSSFAKGRVPNKKKPQQQLGLFSFCKAKALAIMNCSLVVLDKTDWEAC